MKAFPMTKKWFLDKFSTEEIYFAFPQSFFSIIPHIKNGQLNVSELARVCDLSRTTVYKYLSLLEG